MKRFLFVLVVIAAGIVGLGFYQEWFHLGSDNADHKSNVTLSVDTAKIQEDKNVVVAEVKDLGHQIKHKVAGPSDKTDKTMEGTVVSVSADKLTMADKEGKEHSHALAANVTVVTCDGKTCTAADLKAGMKIRVTADEGTPHAASRIEAIDKDAAFASSTHDGKVVSIATNKLVMTNMEGKEKHTCTVSADAKITCDGKICQASDLKSGMRIRVTSETGNAHAATQIEALDKNPDFEKGA